MAFGNDSDLPIEPAGAASRAEGANLTETITETAMLIDLKCWHCGKTATIEVKEPPQFAFQIAGWADDIGWRGHIDTYHGRSLVFCSDEHADAERTKAGHFRLRPKRAN